MTEKAKADGIAFARRVIDERIRSGKLPILGNGYTDTHRAAYAVIQIAERKLSECGRWERPFWRAVADEARQAQIRDLEERIAKAKDDGVI